MESGFMIPRNRPERLKHFLLRVKSSLCNVIHHRQMMYIMTPHVLIVSGEITKLGQYKSAYRDIFLGHHL